MFFTLPSPALQAWIIVRRHACGEVSGIVYAVDKPSQEQAATAVAAGVSPQCGDIIEILGPHALPSADVWVSCRYGRVDSVTTTLPGQILVTEEDLDLMEDDDCCREIDGADRFVYAAGLQEVNPDRIQHAFLAAAR